MITAVILATFGRPKIEWVPWLRVTEANTVVRELRPIEVTPRPTVTSMDVLRQQAK